MALEDYLDLSEYRSLDKSFRSVSVPSDLNWTFHDAEVTGFQFGVSNGISYISLNLNIWQGENRTVYGKLTARHVISAEIDNRLKEIQKDSYELLEEGTCRVTLQDNETGIDFVIEARNVRFEFDRFDVS